MPWRRDRSISPPDRAEQLGLQIQRQIATSSRKSVPSPPARTCRVLLHRAVNAPLVPEQRALHQFRGSRQVHGNERASGSRSRDESAAPQLLSRAALAEISTVADSFATFCTRSTMSWSGCSGRR